MMKIMRVSWTLLVCSFCVVLFGAITVSAQATNSRDELDRQAYELFQQVFSPFCAGRSLNDCPSSKAQELKLEMRAKLEQGVPPQQILEDVFQRFGDQYRAVPQYSGFGKLVWWAPISFLMLGAIVALIIARGRHSSQVKVGVDQIPGGAAGSSEGQKACISADLRKHIESELADLD